MFDIMSQHHFMEYLSSGKSDESGIRICRKIGSLRIIILGIRSQRTDGRCSGCINSLCIKRQRRSWSRGTKHNNVSHSINFFEGYGATAALSGLFCEMNRALGVLTILCGL